MIIHDQDVFKGIWKTPLWDEAPIGMAIVGWIDNQEGMFKKVNRSLCEMLGYTEGELVTKNFMSITHPDDLTFDLEQIEKSIEAKSGYSMVKRYIRKDGKLIWIKLTANPVFDTNDKFLFFLSWIEKLPNGGNYKTLETDDGKVVVRPQVHIWEFFQDNWKPLIIIGLMLMGYIEKDDIITILKAMGFMG